MSVTPKGYNRILVKGRQVMEHVYVWEQHNGCSVPEGHDIHHVDGNKLNNDISNLQLVSKLDHKRIHSGCEMRNGQWWRPCHTCKEFFPFTREYFYYNSSGWPVGSDCKSCWVKKVVVAKRERRIRKKLQDPHG